MKKNWSSWFCALLVPMLGCAMDYDDTQPSTQEHQADTSEELALSAVFSGTVTNAQGAVVAGASVIINGIARTTGSDGKYFCSVPSSTSGYTVTVNKEGFAPVTEFSAEGKRDSVHVLGTAYVQQINPTQANVVTSSAGVSVALQANTLVDANGTPVTAPVKVSVASYHPLSMPGDFTAVNASGQQVALESVGAINVSATLASTGAPLKLKPGATAEAFIPVPPEVGGMPPCIFDGSCRLAMWRFNETTGKWNEQPANITFSSSGTTFTMVGGSGPASLLPGNNGLGTWNADIEKSTPACTVVELVGFPQECYNPTGAATEPGVGLNLKLPNSSSTLVSRNDRVSSLMPFVALYNLRPNAVQEVGISFPAGAPAYCAGNLQISSTPAPAPFYPVLSTTGGVTRFNSGPPWGGVGFPKNSAGKYITLNDMPSNHPCTYVAFQTSNAPVVPPKNAMTWSTLNFAVPSTSHAYVLTGSDATTNPYQGDTSTYNTLPVLCINKNNPMYPGAGVIGNPVQTPGGAWRRTWSGGTVALTTPVRGTTLTSLATANNLCANQFGSGYRMAEFHDGDPTVWSGWDFWGEAINASTSPFKSTRFWVSINDQNANPW